MGILTTDLKPKLAMEECNIGNTKVKIYGIAKGSGMIFPNMATTLGFIFTDAKLSSGILKKILKKSISQTVASSKDLTIKPPQLRQKPPNKSKIYPGILYKNCI